MKRALLTIVLAVLVASAQQITGEQKQWHDVVLTFDGPETSESAETNPFLNYRLDVTFTKGSRKQVVPGYFAADGDAANSSAKSGNKWRVHFVPDEIGDWNYVASFRTGPNIAVSTDPNAGQVLAPDGTKGVLRIEPSDKRGRDHRSNGTLEYVGEHYQRFKGSGNYFIQSGTQSPENFLAYYQFDDTLDHGGAKNRLRDGLHRYEPHEKDWRSGDPVWQGNKGKGIIGALNYLASKGMNTFYSLTMNVDGDGREIYPWTSYDERERYDVSKLAQWEIVMSHMDTLGMQLMVITQEEENEQILGKLTTSRKLYYRELIARFAHHHALLWDLSEEMDRWRYYSSEDIRQLCEYIKGLDPWKHPIQYVQWKGELLPDDKGYGRLLGYPLFDGTALQHDLENTYAQTRKWVDASAAAGHKWLVGVIEINPTSTGVLPDSEDYWHDDVRKQSIWGNLMAGGSGAIFFFGYAHPNSDLDLEDFRSRDHFWDLQRHAHDFFQRYLPFHEMKPADRLTAAGDQLVFAKAGEVYAIYLPNGGSPELDLSSVSGRFRVQWYDPRHGGDLVEGTTHTIQGGGRRSLGEAPHDQHLDWAVLVRRVEAGAGAVSEADALDLAVSRTYHVKLSVPVGTGLSARNDPVRASIISPETLLNGYLSGVVEQVASDGLLIRFHTVMKNGVSMPIRSEVISLVNSKGHPRVDEDEKPIEIEQGRLRSVIPGFYLDEGAELRVRAEPLRQ